MIDRNFNKTIDATVNNQSFNRILSEKEKTGKLSSSDSAQLKTLELHQSTLSPQDSTKVQKINIKVASSSSVLPFIDQQDSTSSNKRTMRVDNVNEYHLSQWTDPDNLKEGSQSGDCGPTAAAMILRANGFSADVQSVRVAANRTTKQGGGWAMQNGQITKAISKLSHGQITQVGGVKPFSDPKKLMNELQKQLDEGKMPILCTGVEDKSKTYRHYMVVVGIENGSLKVADPASYTKPPYNMDPITTITPDELVIRMKNARSHGKETNVTTYQSVK